MFIGALQAYIFTILTAQYISSSISEKVTDHRPSDEPTERNQV